jgi:hypothetical protein
MIEIRRRAVGEMPHRSLGFIIRRPERCAGAPGSGWPVEASRDRALEAGIPTSSEHPR